MEKKTGLKRVISFILSILIIMSMFTVMSLTVSAADTGVLASGDDSGTTGDCTWTYDSSTGTLTISGTGAMEDYTSSTSVPWYSYIGGIKEIIISEGVTKIGRDAFYNCTSLTDISLPNSLINIADWAFAWCTSLASITVPDNVTSIGSYVFWSCTSLKDIEIPDSVTDLGSDVFSCCTNLTEVIIGENLANMGDDEFTKCTKLTNINVSSNNSYFSSDDGVLFNKEMTQLIAYPAGNTRTSYVIPDTVTDIAQSAFYYCEKLVDVTIPQEVTIIESYTFAYCSNLESITIPDNVTYIESYAFYYCEKLTKAEMGEKLISIGIYAFEYCSKLENVVIPNSVVSIGTGAFKYCKSLKSVIMGNSVTSLGIDTFYYCSNLSSIVLSKNVTGISGEAFAYCTSLTDVYYSGSEEDWGNISIGSSNTYLTSATIHYDCPSYDYALGNVGTVSVISANSYKYIAFIPSRSGKYNIYSTGSYDTYGNISNYSGTQLAYNDDSGSGNNFYMTVSLTAGQPYYIGARLYSGTTEESYDITVELVSSSTGGQKINNNIDDIITDTTDTNTYYFYMPEEWKNEYNDNYSEDDPVYSAGIYWWEGTSNCEDNPNAEGNGYPGYNVTDTVADNVYVAHVPEDVATIIWNNSVDGGEDTEADVYTAAIQTTNISCEYFLSGDSDDKYGFFPDGVDSFDGMIYVCDPNAINVNENSGKSTYSGSWLYYYGDGKYGTYATLAEAEANDAVYSDGEFPTTSSSSDPTESTEATTESTEPTTESTEPTTASTEPTTETAEPTTSPTTSTTSPTTESTQPTTTISGNRTSGSGDCTAVFDPTSGTLTISGSGSMIDYTSQANVPWKDYADNITSVVIKKGVKNIGSNAFGYCHSLTSVTIASSVTEIGDYAFYECTSLQSITIPDSVTKIGSYAFCNCTSLTSIKLLTMGVVNIGTNAIGYNYDGSKVSNLILYGYKSCSALQSYAKYNGFTFKSLGAGTTVTLKKSSAKIYIKGTVKISSTVKNGNGKTTYKSSNSKVAKVSSSGKVTGVKKGKATITVTNNGVSKKFKVTVKKPKLSFTKITLRKKSTITMSITGQIGKVKLRSTNKKVAKVSGKKITTLKKGKATIIVKTNGIKLKCKVTVK